MTANGHRPGCSPGPPVFRPGSRSVTMAQKYYATAIHVIDTASATRRATAPQRLQRRSGQGERGDCVAFSGNRAVLRAPTCTTKALRGPGQPVGFFDMEMPVEDYMSWFVTGKPANTSKKEETQMSRTVHFDATRGLPPIGDKQFQLPYITA